MSVFEIKRLPHGEGLPLPAQGTPLSAGYDLCAAVEETQILEPFQRLLIPCGFSVALAPGFEGQIRARSGLSFKNGIAVLNAPGTIDADYRGEVKVLLINLGQEPFSVTRGMRIAQLVIARFEQVSWQEVEELTPDTNRGEEGFGSTGLYAQA